MWLCKSRQWSSTSVRMGGCTSLLRAATSSSVSWLCTVWWCDCCVLCDGVPVVYCVMVWLLCTMWWCDCCVLCDGVTVVYCVMVCLLCTVWWCDCCVLCDGVTVVYYVMVWLLCTVWWCDSCVLCDGVPVVYCVMVWLLCTMWWCDCCVLCDGVTVVYYVMVCLLCTLWWCACCVLCDGVPVVYYVMVWHLPPGWIGPLTELREILQWALLAWERKVTITVSHSVCGWASVCVCDNYRWVTHSLCSYTNSWLSVHGHHRNVTLGEQYTSLLCIHF